MVLPIAWPLLPQPDFSCISTASPALTATVGEACVCSPNHNTPRLECNDAGSYGLRVASWSAGVQPLSANGLQPSPQWSTVCRENLVYSVCVAMQASSTVATKLYSEASPMGLFLSTQQGWTNDERTDILWTLLSKRLAEIFAGHLG